MQTGRFIFSGLQLLGGFRGAAVALGRRSLATKSVHSGPILAHGCPIFSGTLWGDLGPFSCIFLYFYLHAEARRDPLDPQPCSGCRRCPKKEIIQSAVSEARRWPSVAARWQQKACIPGSFSHMDASFLAGCFRMPLGYHPVFFSHFYLYFSTTLLVRGSRTARDFYE